MRTNFRIAVTQRNAADWVGRCLDSLSALEYDGDYSCVVVDDASDDGSLELIERHPLMKSGRAMLLRGEERVGSLANYVRAFAATDRAGSSEGDVYIALDGDDWLFSPLVLQLLDETYRKTGCWMTWGSYVTWPLGAYRGKDLPQFVHERNLYRRAAWVSSHLRTFRSFLWHRIRDEDLRDDHGRYFQIAGDLAFMFPLLEMARERARFIPEVLYVYNQANPLNDHKIDRAGQICMDRLIRARQPYQRLLT